MQAESSHSRSPRSSRSSRSHYSFASHGELNVELLRQAHWQQSTSATTTLSSFTATLQPYARPSYPGNEDRCVVQRWALPSGEWTLAAVFDGHAGYETAEYASAALPRVIREHVEHACNAVPVTPEEISARLAEAIHAFDDSLVHALRDSLPENIQDTSDAEVRSLINDQASGGNVYAKLVRCMRGCTALVALVDSTGRDVWVANLGDSQAVFAERSASGVRTSFPSSPHNGANPSEAQRVRNEHPGEPRAIMGGRVLGALTTTRALGDHAFKMPALFTQKILLNAHPGFKAPDRVRALTEQMPTPPYVSSKAEVVHRRLQSSPSSPTSFALILCTDGLTDLYEQRGTRNTMARRWADLIFRDAEAGQTRLTYAGLGGNKALHIMKDALGGTLDRQSMMLTSYADEPWMDDTTLVVLTWN